MTLVILNGYFYRINMIIIAKQCHPRSFELMQGFIGILQKIIYQWEEGGKKVANTLLNKE